CTEKEGSEILVQIKDKATNILTNKGFSEDGICQESKAEYANGNIATKTAEQVAAAIDNCRQDNHTGDSILANPVPYENPESSVKIAIDDVIVKKQEETRKCGKKSDRGKRK
ncbi:MAG: hypothetical protein IMF19_03480, partial [Proteobacteria bacterium]|nr:hypothetical protein [Pseudomonadota bacterium]